MTSEIYFNSKSEHFYKLSNFYGGVEANYMKDRFKDKEVIELFNTFETANKDEFIYYLQVLQPNKKVWTKAMLNFWIKDCEPIHGILSQLVGTSVKDTPTAKRRQKIVKQMAGINEAAPLCIKPNTSDQEKQELMKKLLRQKFSVKEFADILLSTGDSILHEKPMRGKPNNWTYKDGNGGDWLGKLLMEIREEIRNEK